MENKTEMDIQQLVYFTEGNTFTGSKTKDPAAGTMLRYLVKPDAEKTRLLAYAWNDDVCFEMAKEPREKDFPLSDEGIEEICLWLQGQFDQL